MATQKQRETARKNVKKAQTGARQKRTISNLSQRHALGARPRGREGGGAQARRVEGNGHGRRRDDGDRAPPGGRTSGIEGRSKMGKAQLIRAVGQKRRSS